MLLRNLDLSYYIGETLLFTISTQYGDFINLSSSTATQYLVDRVYGVEGAGLLDSILAVLRWHGPVETPVWRRFLHLLGYSRNS